MNSSDKLAIILCIISCTLYIIYIISDIIKDYLILKSKKQKTFWLVNAWDEDKKLFKSKEKAVKWFYSIIFTLNRPVECFTEKSSIFVRYYNTKNKRFYYLTLEEIPFHK